MATTSVESDLPLPIVVIAGWLAPGLGYWLLGHKTRGLTVGVTIIALFILGLLIGGIRVIDAPGSLDQLPAKPWFLLQGLSGTISILSAMVANHVTIVSHARSFEIGTLYTAIAGFLNLLTLVDCGYRCSERGPA